MPKLVAWDVPTPGERESIKIQTPKFREADFLFHHPCNGDKPMAGGDKTCHLWKKLQNPNLKLHRNFNSQPSSLRDL
jgi:hypothetical protein